MGTTRDGPLTDAWGDVSEAKVVAKMHDVMDDAFKNIQIEEIFIYRDSNNYPDGCELTFRTWASKNPMAPIKVAILGQPFKDLQKIILATMGFEDADEIE